MGVICDHEIRLCEDTISNPLLLHYGLICNFEHNFTLEGLVLLGYTFHRMLGSKAGLDFRTLSSFFVWDFSSGSPNFTVFVKDEINCAEIQFCIHFYYGLILLRYIQYVVGYLAIWFAEVDGFCVGWSVWWYNFETTSTLLWTNFTLIYIPMLY